MINPALLVIAGIFLLRSSTASPTSSSSLSPSSCPSSLPSFSPSPAPTYSPSVSPSSSPSSSSCPTMAPTQTRAPTITQSPSGEPTNAPSKVPTATCSPSSSPTLGSTDSPTTTRNPSSTPTSRPTLNPSIFISTSPTTQIPTTAPSTSSPSSSVSQILTIKLRFASVTFRSLSTREKNEFEDNIQLCISISENLPLDAVDLKTVSSIADGDTRITTEILFFSLNSATFFMERVSNDSSTIFNTENLFRVADYGVPIVEDVCLCTTPRDNSSNDSTSLILIIGMACAGVAVCCCLYFGWRLCRSKMRRSRERRVNSGVTTDTLQNESLML
eukprot:CAMPEP_0185256186 /NCGR_PEP_ID=MMETSP1359-20130426/5241_1 /TAXON_ID=552665 /ORGANISM="Bigelowiella longifila, Strain CCMP242" /LENGTH=329 /DNA_ID=CAMNT_0027840583 /DNA_START=147 /DNA_END=1136 /DNA_ORIENTATION=+